MRLNLESSFISVHWSYTNLWHHQLGIYEHYLQDNLEFRERGYITYLQLSGHDKVP